MALRKRGQNGADVDPVASRESDSAPAGRPQTRGAGPTRRGQDALGKFTKGNTFGRPKGSRDTRPRIGSIKAVYEEFIEVRDGHKAMVDAVEAGVKDTKRALGYIELGAKVLDSTQEVAGKFVHFHLHTNVDIYALGKAAERAGLPPLVKRVEGNGATRSPST